MVVDGPRRFEVMRWGLVPFWAKDPRIGRRTINARAETLADKPAFRAAFRARRCLVPGRRVLRVDRPRGNRQPLNIHRSDGHPLALAGLWEFHAEFGPTFTIVTTAPNAYMAAFHHRMPAILEPRDWDAWLAAETKTQPGARLCCDPPPTACSPATRSAPPSTPSRTTGPNSSSPQLPSAYSSRRRRRARTPRLALPTVEPQPVLALAALAIARGVAPMGFEISSGRGKSVPPRRTCRVRPCRFRSSGRIALWWRWPGQVEPGVVGERERDAGVLGRVGRGEVALVVADDHVLAVSFEHP